MAGGIAKMIADQMRIIQDRQQGASAATNDSTMAMGASDAKAKRKRKGKGKGIIAGKMQTPAAAPGRPMNTRNQQTPKVPMYS